MEGCEQFARNLHFSTMYLSTHDKEEFYKKLGFNLCEPICHYGSATKISTNKVFKLFFSFNLHYFNVT